jgi:hypothetical protein
MVTIHLSPSSGNSNTPRVLSEAWGSVLKPCQSDGASSGIAKIAVAYPISDLDGGFIRRRPPRRSEQAQCEIASSSSIDDQIGGQRLAIPVGILAADCGHRRAIRRGYEVADAATRTQADIGVPVHALSRRQLDQRTGHGINEPAEIALRERIVTRHLGSNVKGDTKRHRPGARELLFEAGKQLVKRMLAASQQRVNMPRLRYSGPVSGVWRQGVSFQYDDLLEVIGERARRRQTTHPSSDNDGLLTYERRGHRCLRWLLPCARPSAGHIFSGKDVRGFAERAQISSSISLFARSRGIQS